MKTLVLLLVILYAPRTQAGFECKRTKNADGEIVTKCEQNGESQIKVKVGGDQPSQVIADQNPNDRVPPELLNEISQPNDATLLDWPCSSARAPEITVMPEIKNGTRKIGISGTYKTSTCGKMQINFPTGRGTVILDCSDVGVYPSGNLDLCVTAQNASSGPLDHFTGITYFRGSSSASTLNLANPDSQGKPLRIVAENFGRIDGPRDLQITGQLKIKGPTEEKTVLKNLTILSGALSLENVHADRITAYKGVKLYLKNSEIRALRWFGEGKSAPAHWDYLGPIER